MKGPLKKKGTSSEHSDLYVFVFDHVLLLTKEKKTKGVEGYKVHKRPIPLELLNLSTMEEPIVKSSRRSSSLIPHKSSSHASNVVSKITPTSGPLAKITSDSKSGYPIVFTHIGRHGSSFTLYATTHAGRKNWMDKIQKQIQALRSKADAWKLVPVSERFFPATNKVTCSSTCGMFALSMSCKLFLDGSIEDATNHLFSHAYVHFSRRRKTTCYWHG